MSLSPIITQPFASAPATLIAAQGLEVCATAADGEEAVARATELRPDIVIITKCAASPARSA